MCRWLILLVLAAAVSTVPARAQDNSGPPRVADVEIRGDIAPFRQDDLFELLRTRPNRRFLGIPGATPSLWLYEAGTPETAVGRALQRAGEPPALYDPATADGDRERLEILYRQAGFLEATAAVEVDSLRGDRVRVIFTVAPGPASRVRDVTFAGIGHLSSEERQRLVGPSVLALQPPPVPLLDEPTLAARPVQRLAETQLLAERRRLLTDLRNLGFARVTRDSIRAIAFPVDTLETGGGVFDVRMEIQTGPRFAFGDVRFRVTGPEAAPPRVDTVAVGDGAMIYSIVDDRRLTPALLRRSMRFGPGDIYREADLLDLKRRLDATGVFTFSEIVPLPAEIAAPARGDTLARLPHRVTLRTRPRHSIRLEGFVLQRTGILGNDGGTLGGEELGVGGGLRYANANTFGSGELFSAGLSASVAGDFVEFPTAQAEGNLGLTLPYLAWPFGGLDRSWRPYDTRTRFTMGLLTARRDELRIVIRGRASLGMRLEVQHSPRVSSWLDLIDFRLSDPDTLQGFQRQFLDLITDPVARQFVLEDYTQPQVNNAVRYTLRSLTADLLRRDRGHVREVTAESGGTVPYLLDRFVFSPGEIDGSLPGVPLFGGGGRLEYRPYLRTTIDLREYRRIGRLSVLAARFNAGVAHPVGHAPVVPFDRRFYAGGIGSVRGWELRQLGPGRVPPEASAFVQGGDIRLEASTEARRIVLRRLLGADWQLAAFADAGNVWFGPRNPGDPDGRFGFDSFVEEIAIGSGVGARVLWDFLIVRLDLAWKVRSPVPGDPLFPDGNRPRLHFGIGQAF